MLKNAHLHTHFRSLDTTYSFPPRVWDVIEQTLKLFKNLIQSKGLSISQKTFVSSNAFHESRMNLVLTMSLQLFGQLQYASNS